MCSSGPPGTHDVDQAVLSERSLVWLVFRERGIEKDHEMHYVMNIPP